MKQTTLNIKSNLLLQENMDFIFEAIEIAVLIENADRKVEFVNTQFCNLFQINIHPSLIHHTSILDNIHSFSSNFENEKEFENVLLNYPNNAIIIKNENWKLKNGKKIILDYTPIYKTNDLQGHIWIFKISHQTSSYNFFNTSNNIEKALDFLQDEIAIFNSEGIIVFANKKYIPNNEKRLWAKGKLLSQYFSYANLPAQIANSRMEYILNVFASGQSVYLEEEQVNKKGGIQYSLRTFYPVFNENNNVETVIEHASNITSQKELENKLKKVTTNYYATLDNLTESIIETDDELKIEFLNKAWENISGQNNDEYKGKSIFEILSVTKYELYRKVFTILSGNASQKDGLLTMTEKDGKEIKLKYNLNNTFNVHTGKQGVIATLSDITNKVMQETQLIELIKREKELNELKTAFVNMVSHELRTPLTVISSSAEILDLMLLAGKSHEEVSVYTKQIIDEVEKMTAFMQDLLMVSKIEAGKIETNLQETDLLNFINQIVEKGFKPWKDGRITEIEIKRKPEKIYLDTNLLAHALQNLLHNAFKYSAGQANVKIRVSFSKTYCNISVIDKGIGIPKNEIEKLFTSFFRASNTGNINGTGIGLIVAKYFTEQHNGTIAVRSKINKGSIFTLKLPYNHNENYISSRG